MDRIFFLEKPFTFIRPTETDKQSFCLLPFLKGSGPYAICFCDYAISDRVLKET